MLPHELAVLFHSTYERLAPAFGWRTKKGCNVPFEQLPQRNKALMLATCQTVLNALQEQSSPALPAHNNARDEILPGQCPTCHGCGYVMVSHVNECYQCGGTGKTSPVA